MLLCKKSFPLKSKFTHVDVTNKYKEFRKKPAHLKVDSTIINQQQQQQQQLFGNNSALRLPAIDPGGSSPRNLIDQPTHVDSLPPHLHQSKLKESIGGRVGGGSGGGGGGGGTKRKHRRRRKGSEMSTGADTQSQQQSEQFCQDENHIQHGLCEANAPCYVTAAEAFAKSGGFSLPEAFTEHDETDADADAAAAAADETETMATTRVEFDLPNDADSEDSPQNRFHDQPKPLVDVDRGLVQSDDVVACSLVQSDSVEFADDEMVSNESPHYYSDNAGTPLDSNCTPTPTSDDLISLSEDNVENDPSTK